MASLDWSKCPAVESIPGKVSGAWVFKGTRTPVAIVFENLVSARPRVHAIYDPKFWDNWKKMPASELGRFLAIADKGTPKPATPLPAGKTAGQQRIEDLEICVRYTRELLKRL